MPTRLKLQKGCSLRLLDVSGQNHQILHFTALTHLLGLLEAADRPLAVSSMLTFSGLRGMSYNLYLNNSGGGIP
jgi:hypothetical protein